MKLRRRGHERVLKLFVNRKAADDGRERLEARFKERNAPGGVECLTTHAAALEGGATGLRPRRRALTSPLSTLKPYGPQRPHLESSWAAAG